MSGPARVTSIDVLPLLAAGLAKFRGEAQGALDDLTIETRRILEWIHNDRKDYWRRELQRAYEHLNQARLQLQQARTARRVGDHEPACIDEKRAVERAKRRVETAHEKVEAVRHWAGVVDRAVDDFQRVRTQFAAWLEIELPRAVAALNQMSESLVSYISIEAPADPLRAAAGGPAGETASGDAAEETPGRRPTEKLRAVKEWDLNAAAGKIELALKTLRITLAAAESQWTDQARRQFQETHLTAVEPNIRSMLDAIGQLNNVLDAAQRQCSDESQ